MVDVWNERVTAEGEGIWATVEWFAEGYDHLVRCDPATDVVIAEDDADNVVGYARVSWDDVAAGYRAYRMAFVANPEIDGLEAQLFAWSEARARAIAAGHDAADQRLETAAPDGSSRQRLLVDRGFVPFAKWGFMVRDLIAIPDCLMPTGLAIRPVAEGHLRAIWEADTDAFRDDPDFVEPTEEDWERFRDEAAGGTELWQVAWDADRVVGSSPDSTSGRRRQRAPRSAPGVDRGHLDPSRVASPRRRGGADLRQPPSGRSAWLRRGRTRRRSRQPNQRAAAVRTARVPRLAGDDPLPRLGLISSTRG